MSAYTLTATYDDGDVIRHEGLDRAGADATAFLARRGGAVTVEVACPSCCQASDVNASSIEHHCEGPVPAYLSYILTD